MKQAKNRCLLTMCRTKGNDMTKAWTSLLRSSGSEIGTPTIGHLTDAVAELYQEPIPGAAAVDGTAAGSVSLRSGHDQGPMYVLSISRQGVGTWEEWADQNYEAELCPARELALAEAQALKLLSHIVRGNIDLVRTAFADAVEL
jgi:hypothetical protein